ncbi:DUF4166 domain-containing protein [Roseibium sp. MMSF_3412]|uniref:DUF4166 domain-containing protein n=1 Tax=Roseibium sp. MMSF_3412 TaxID=3046712 RepID=UPI00273DF455|nr:DUF4166 domain-containing protein [Roseibium sp. MMSF_3412]
MLDQITAHPGSAVPDHRFRQLLGEAAWQALPQPVRSRFGKRMKGGSSVVYQGVVVAMRRNIAGYVLSHLARLVGAPLPYDSTSLNQPAVVTVTEDCAGDGQFWVRQYGRASGFPQVIHSSKRFSGPTGIEEYIGSGIGMALRVGVEDGGLSFRSDHYFLQFGSWRLRLPGWCSPGALTITHRDLGDARFLFSLTLESRFFGELVHQDALFHDMEVQP